MQKLYQRSMFHLLRVKGQLAPALLAKVTVVEVISAKPKVISVFPALLLLLSWISPRVEAT